MPSCRATRLGCGSTSWHRRWPRATARGCCMSSAATRKWARPNEPSRARGPGGIELSRRQLDFGDGLIAEEVGELWEDWMRHVDALLDDPHLLDAAYQALACRWTHSRTCGR